MATLEPSAVIILLQPKRGKKETGDQELAEEQVDGGQRWSWELKAAAEAWSLASLFLEATVNL